MFVTCSACSARFDLPDDKIAGRKARMKCKTCGAPIAIDGTGLAAGGAAPHKAPPVPSRPSGGAKAETLSFNDQTVALGVEEAAALSTQSRRAEAPSAPDLEDRITPVSKPHAAPLLDERYVDAALDALEQKVFSVPAPKPANTAPPAATAPTAAAAAAAAAPPAATAPAAVPPAKPAPLPPKAPLPKPSALPKPAATIVDDEEATRMMDLPRLLSGAATAPPAAPTAPPAASSSSGRPLERPQLDGDAEEATRMHDVQIMSPGASDEATRIFDPDPAPRAPRLPPRPSLPRPAGSEPAQGASVAHDAPVILSDPTPYDAPAAELPSGAPPPLPHRSDPRAASSFAASSFAAPSLAPPAPSSPSAAGSASGVRSDLTVQRDRVSSPAASSNWGLYLFALAVAATATLVVAFFFARPSFDRAIAQTRSVLGLAAADAASGPTFDREAASAELTRIAAAASSCKRPSGPTGAGRARVLFQMSGAASTAVLSPPFHASASEACLLDLFKTARVPRFGGQPVIVTKTFRID